jgi:ParB family chromosome partitioning protein
VEEIARTTNTTSVSIDNKKQATSKLPDEFSILKEHLSKFFGTKVQLSYNSDGKGKITIPFDSDKKLENIMSLLDRMK